MTAVQWTSLGGDDVEATLGAWTVRLLRDRGEWAWSVAFTDGRLPFWESHGGRCATRRAARRIAVAVVRELEREAERAEARMFERRR